MKNGWLVFLLLCSAPAYAAPTTAELKATQAQLQQSKQRAEKLAQEKAQLEKDLAAQQEKLVTLAETTREREQRLIDLEEEQSELDAEVKTAQETLKLHHKEVASLVSSLIRLSRIPPEAVIAMPGELRHTMQAASLLQTTTHQLQQKAGDLTRKLNQLERAQTSLEKTRLALAREKQNTVLAQEALAKQVTKSEKLSEQLNQQHTQEESKVALLTRQSQNLQQLLDKLERDRRAQEARAKQAAIKPIAKPAPSVIASVPAAPPKHWEPLQQPKAIADQKFASFNAARGKLHLPVAGRIAERYGQKLRQNQTSRGMAIASRAGNAVVAPYAGEVVFTGQFLDYGRMVILRYDSGYHLLLAGLDAINCIVGQRVIAGEPVGRIGSTGAKPGSLYLELRYQSKPINPSPWFG